MTLTPGQQRLKKEWLELSKAEQWEKLLHLYECYHRSLVHQLKGTASELNQLEIENNK